ncbi:transcriptional regulator [Clostridium ihumii]|uniref:transcriptional regulator n=1 Tax=Clostridium ihumii TaxID=1470356 RepID=UPI000A4E5C8D|nr:transcriptional regulator [Clostridium ihumii]
MSLKVVPPKDLEKLNKTIEALRQLIKTDVRETDRIIHKQALEDLIEYRKSLNIKK